MMKLPSPSARAILCTRTPAIARGADVRTPRSLRVVQVVALIVLTCATSSSIRVVAQTAADSSPVHVHALSSPSLAAAVVAAFTLPENIPDFSQDTSRPAVQSAASGTWSSAATWEGGQIPTSNHVVRILQNHTVTINDTSALAYTIAVDGKLAFASGVNTRVKVTNLQVMAGDMGMGAAGVLEVGTVANPIDANVTAEIIIADSPLGGSVSDTDQYGTGLVVLGKVVMHGSVKTPTFVRLATEPRAGNTTLALSEAVSGWKVGDRLVLPDTRHIKESEVTGSGWINAVNQWEERTVQAISADGRALTLDNALQYDHLGARDLNNVLDFLPHVGNMTRNVIVRSERATGTRGHMLGIHRADVDIRYALFKDLGRTTYQPLNVVTNHIGRYPIHMHHLSGPLPTPANGYQFTVVGNAIDGGSVETKFKWALTVHGSHYGSIKDNVVYNYNGAAIATEDGSESFNVFDHNFALRGIGEPNDSVSEARMAMGTEGVGFWFRGPNNYVKNNVAANYQNSTTEAAYGFAFQFRYLGNIAVPNSKGAMDAGQFTTKNGNNLPLLQFENNEAYGAMQGGFTYWWVSSADPQPYANAQESLIKDLKLWHIYNKTIYHYPSQKITFDGLTIRGTFVAGVSRCCGDGVYFPDYSAKNIVIRNSDIQGVETGIDAPVGGFGPGPNLLVENSYLRNAQNINVGTNWSVNGCYMQDKLVEIRNTRIEAPPGRSLSAINMGRANSNGIECLNILDEVRVYAYNGVATDNFQVYHSNTAVLPRPPSGCTPATRSGISNGVTCPIAAQGPVAPTVTFSASPASIASGQSATLTWSSTNATAVSINQGIGTVAASGTRSVAPTATTTYTLTGTNAAGSVTATAAVTVAATRITPTITWSTPASIIYQTALSGTQLNATTTVAGAWTYSPASGTVLAAGTGQALSVTFTPTDSVGYNPANASVAITVLKATPIITWANPSDISSGTALSGTQLNSTASVAGSSTYTPPSGTMLGVGAGQALSTAFTPTSTANYNLASKTVMITVTGTATTGHNAARANSYDDVWQDGSTGWVANARAILAGGTGQSGLVLWIGDSLTRDPALGAWAQAGAGKTAEDQMITNWMHAGLSPQSIDSLDGFALATPYFCPARSYTVGDSLGSWDFMGGSMPADTNPATAREKLQNCTAYPNALNLTTMLTALPKAQFAIPEVNLDASNPGVFTDFERMVDLMIAKGIVPIIVTYTYRNDAAFNLLVDRYNTALVAYAQLKKLPLIDFNQEMLARLPFAQWTGRFLSSDGTHYSRGTTTYPSTSDPYANGGDPATHTTGLALTYDGYGLKGWLGVQKMKEIKQLVVDGVSPSPTVTAGTSPASITSGAASTLSWSSTNATTVSIDQGIGTVAATGTRSVSPASTTTYTVTATNTAGSVTATATVTVALPSPLPTVTLSASPASITSGAASTLTWSSTNAASVSIDQGIGPVAVSGTRSVSPASTTTYTATATNATGSVTATASVTTTTSSDTIRPTVTAIAPRAGVKRVSLSATVRVTFSEPMKAATITTSTIVLRDPANGVVPATVLYDAALRAGVLTPSSPLSGSTRYTATITGVQDVAGNALSSPYVSSFTTAAAPAATMPTVTLSASPASITPGAASTLTWASTNATSVTINQGIGAVAVSGTRSVSPASTTGYTVTATNAAGSATATATVTVSVPPPLPTATLSASPASIAPGAASTLTWSSTNATTVTINQGIGTVAASGTRSVSPASTTIYTITATNASGAVTRTATVTVTTSTAIPRSLFSASSAPSVFATADSAAIELGVKFRADVDGAVTGVRFYKGATNTGTHVGTLWSMTGAMLAQVTFAGETASGWQQATFSTPVSITAGTFYVVSYHTTVGQYGYTADTFLTAWVDNAPLHAPRSGSSGGTGGNGVYEYGGVAFPTQTSNAANYWVDVLFVPQ